MGMEQERRALLKAHLAGAVPMELLKEEQERIAKELADAGVMLANTEVHWEKLERDLERALVLTSRIADAYRNAAPNVRRQLNQAVFEQIQVDLGGTIMYARMAEPFSSFNDREFRNWLVSGAPNPEPSEAPGSNMARLVEAMGLEPLTS
jgi:site-specific DNA recombinase